MSDVVEDFKKLIADGHDAKIVEHLGQHDQHLSWEIHHYPNSCRKCKELHAKEKIDA